jgi:undecaprenyl-diphosphatase
MMTTLQALIIAIVEGLTEFIPISSTAHMRITENLLGLSNTDKFVEAFTIAIQFGAILSVVVLYWRKFFDFSRISFYVKLMAAIVPALIFGFLFSKKIDEMLETPKIIACIMFGGGVILLFVDKWFARPLVKSERDISLMKAVQIGCFQCLAVLLPGLSRSAATIVGGMSLRVSRSAAAEFSFFLAVPTMFAATVYKLYKYVKENGAFTSSEVKLLAFGNVVAFVVALAAIKFFIATLKTYGFRVWGVYRILVGGILLIMLFMGYIS